MTQEKTDRRLPELLVPANNLRVLRYAVQYGADAVYIGGKEFNLRSIRGNFSPEDMYRGLQYAHAENVKVYLTLNAFIHEDELGDFKRYLESLCGLELDGIIISDPGIIPLIRYRFPDTDIHLSTQANITNHEAVSSAARLGIKRVNPARELSFKSLKGIIRNSSIQVEVFIHGALCISYSGRCMLSKYMSGRDANKGRCAHSCRWRYFLVEEERSNLFFPVQQDSRGTYIYNSRDLCLLPQLDRLVDAGPDSLKIEGRMKTESYVSLVTWVYRKALDLIEKDGLGRDEKQELMSELDKASHRNFTTGFMFARDRTELEDNDNVGYIKKYTFVGTIERMLSGKVPVVSVRNQVRAGEDIDILQPGRSPLIKKTGRIMPEDGQAALEVANPNDRVVMEGLAGISSYSILRKRSGNGPSAGKNIK